jgi:hypothetical protein
MNAGARVPNAPALVPDQRATIRSVVVNEVDRSKASSIITGANGSFERAIGPGSMIFSPGLSHEPGLKGQGALVLVVG